MNCVHSTSGIPWNDHTKIKINKGKKIKSLNFVLFEKYGWKSEFILKKITNCSIVFLVKFIMKLERPINEMQHDQ